MWRCRQLWLLSCPTEASYAQCCMEEALERRGVQRNPWDTPFASPDIALRLSLIGHGKTSWRIGVNDGRPKSTPPSGWTAFGTALLPILLLAGCVSQGRDFADSARVVASRSGLPGTVMGPSNAD